MHDILYVKFSNGRSKKYQVKTEIIRKDGKEYVKKSPIYKEGKEHIYDIYKNAEHLQGVYMRNKKVEICHSEMSGDNIVFDYVHGKSYEQYFGEICERREKTEILSALKQFYQIISSMADRNVFNKTEAFVDVFGNADVDTNTLSGVDVDIDMTFSNLIIGDKVYVIDYEWSFPFPIPLEYVFFRALFTSRIFSMLDVKLREEIYQDVGLSITKRRIYSNMEHNFQNYVREEQLTMGVFANRFQLKSINIADIDWEHQGYTITCFGRIGECAEEIYSGVVQNGSICLEIELEKKDYDRVEIFCAPIESAIQIEIILGYKNGESVVAEYTTTADYEENGVEYYSQNTPVFIVKNESYDKIICKYVTRIWNDSVVKKIVNKRNELINERNELINERNELINEKQCLQREIETIKMSKTWRIMSKLRRWE